jgi:hypothetical protein
MALKRKARLQERRSLVEGLVRRLLVRVVSGDLDAQEGFGQVRQIYADESVLMSELKAMAELESASNEKIKAEAEDWLRQHPLIN